MLIMENILGLLDIMKPNRSSSYVFKSASISLFCGLFEVIKENLMQYPEYIWPFVECSFSLVDAKNDSRVFHKIFCDFWSCIKSVIELLYCNTMFHNEECAFLFIRLYFYLTQYYHLKESPYNFDGLLQILSRYLLSIDAVLFSLLRANSSDEIASLKSSNQLSHQSEHLINYLNVIFYLISLEDIYVYVGVTTSLCSFLKFILSENDDYSMLFPSQFVSRLIFQIQRMFPLLREAAIPAKNVYNTILNVLALVNLMFPKRLVGIDGGTPKCDVFSHANYLKAFSDQDVVWSFLVCFIFPSCSQSITTNSSTLTLPFFMSQEVVNGFLKLPESFSLSSIASANAFDIVSRLSDKNRKKLLYLIKRSRNSKFRISGFKAINFGSIDFDESSFNVPENTLPSQFLSQLQQFIISTIEDSNDRYMFSLLRIFCALPTNTHINPTSCDPLDITLSENGLYFSSLFSIFLMNRKMVPLPTCLNVLFKGVGKCLSFEALYPVVQYYFTSLCIASCVDFVEYISKSPFVPRLDLAKYFYKTNDFIKASYFFELAHRHNESANCIFSSKYLKNTYKELDIPDDAAWFSSQCIYDTLFPVSSEDSDMLVLQEASLKDNEQKHFLAYEIALKHLKQDQYSSAFCFLDSYCHQAKDSWIPLFIWDAYAAAAWKLQTWNVPLKLEMGSCSTQFIPSLFNSALSKLSDTKSILNSFSKSLIIELENNQVLHSVRFNNLNFFNLLFTFSVNAELPLLLKTYGHISSPLLICENSEKILFFHYLASMLFNSSTLIPYTIKSLKLTRSLKLHNMFRYIFEKAKVSDNKCGLPIYPKATQMLYHQCKYLWDRELTEAAVHSLQKLTLPFEKISQTDEFERNQQSKLRRRLSQWKLSSQSYNLNDLLPIFNEAIQLSPKNEKNYYALANFQLRLFSNFKYNQSDCSREEIEWILNAMKNFARVVIIGKSLTNESFPKLLSFWLNVKNEALFSSIHKVVIRLFERITPAQFCSQFTHLISRICHERQCVSDLISKCILLLFKDYPHTVLWNLLSVSMSSHPLRASRANDILQSAKVFPGMISLVDTGINFTEALIHLCNAQVTATSASLQKDFKFLKKLFPVNIQLPNLHCLKFKFDDSLLIVDMQDKIEIMLSLQRPKKLTFYACNGNPYIFLCKPKDDLRKDSRFMEYLMSIGDLLSSNAESSKRKLTVRPYAAVPLNDECGLIEWVPHTTTYRSILNGIYESKKMLVPPKRLKEIAALKKPERDIFCDHFLPLFPKVFFEWFYFTWSDPHQWLVSRLKYTQTLAIMSIVGWIIGLGDRHGENILLDAVSGEIVHVDFNCLFDKGLAFAKPEVVPFRLTHNMVDAMGIPQTEGSFKRCCSIVLQIIRTNRTFLLRNLETFVYDPIIEWSGKPSKLNSENDSAEARRILHSIECKVRGIVGNIPKSGFSFSEEILSLSIEGQVSELIKESTSIENLCRMYVGWAPFM